MGPRFGLDTAARRNIPNIHYCVYKGLPLDPVLSQWIPVHILTPVSLTSIIILRSVIAQSV